MNKINDIKATALSIGACDKICKVTDYASLVKLFFSPQGQEFCETNNFPTHSYFKVIKKDVKPHNVFVDCGQISIFNTPQIALVGKTHAKIKVSGLDSVYTVMLMHGATAEIEASDYAVLKIVNISGGEVAIHNDNTTRIL